jgi:hypothetical protein
MNTQNLTAQKARNKKRETKNEKRQTVNEKEIITTAWLIAYTALWNTTEFSQQEVNNASQFIYNFINKAPNPKKAFEAFVQRVLIARNYVANHQGKYIPIPSIWFSIQNTNGFAGTQKWLQDINQTRQAIPLYKIELLAFAQAVQEYAKTNTAADFHYWRSYFIQQNKQGLLNLFLSTIANLQHQ